MSRTKLSFQTCNQVLEYVNGLLESGYTKQGNWSLGQICYHLSKAMKFWRRVRSHRFGALLFTTGIPRMVPYAGELLFRIGLSAPAPLSVKPEQPVNDAEGVQLLAEALHQDTNSKQYASNNAMQLWHCGHHLGFLHPHNTTM